MSDTTIQNVTDGDARNYRTHYDINGRELRSNFDDIMDEMTRCPVAKSVDGDGYWVLNSYSDVRAAAHDWETFSSREGFIPNRPPGMSLTPPIDVDPPLHTDLRSVINPYLGPKNIRKHEPSIRRTANQLIDRFIERGEVEIVSEFGNALAGHVWCTVVAGMPAADMPFLQRAFQEGLHGPMEQRAEANARALNYAIEYIKIRSKEPSRGDIVDAILAFEAPGFDLGQKGLTLGMLTQGGIGTSGGVIAGGLYYLARHLEDRRRLVSAPSLLPRAIEEFLRFYASAPQLGRKVLRDTEVSGVKIAEGDWVVLSYGAANRDPNIHSSAREIDIDRTPNRHLAFGAGPHRCAGSHLARLNLRIAFETFLARIPDFTTVPEEFEPDFEIGVTRDMVELPLGFAPGHALD
jgi:cytochrome P450